MWVSVIVMLPIIKKRICSVLGDWHTAYLLIYGPRKLPKAPANQPDVTKNTEPAAGETEKMETS